MFETTARNNFQENYTADQPINAWKVHPTNRCSSLKWCTSTVANVIQRNEKLTA